MMAQIIRAIFALAGLLSRLAQPKRAIGGLRMPTAWDRQANRHAIHYRRSAAARRAIKPFAREYDPHMGRFVALREMWQEMRQDLRNMHNDLGASPYESHNAHYGRQTFWRA
jgi:hypothetical protein